MPKVIKIWNARNLYKSLLEKLDVDKVKRERRLLPGGDIRLKENSWVRESFRDSGLRRVPRETRIRIIVEKICRKHGLCTFSLLIS